MTNKEIYISTACAVYDEYKRMIVLYIYNVCDTKPLYISEYTYMIDDNLKRYNMNKTNHKGCVGYFSKTETEQ